MDFYTTLIFSEKIIFRWSNLALICNKFEKKPNIPLNILYNDHPRDCGRSLEVAWKWDLKMVVAVD